MKYFKVIFGIGIDDFISIDEEELRLAMVAQINGKIAVLKEGTVAGNNIRMILPDYNREMGYNRDYKLTGEDYAHIGNRSESLRIIEKTRDEIGGKSKIGILNNNKMIEDLTNKLKASNVDNTLSQ